MYTTSGAKACLQFTKTTEEVAAYAAEEYKSVGPFVSQSLEKLKLVLPTRPPPPLGTAESDDDEEGDTGAKKAAKEKTVTIDPFDKQEYDKELKLHVKEKRAVKTAVKNMFKIVWGQCSEAMKTKLKSHHDYETVSTKSDTIKLLTIIRQEMTGFTERRYLPHALHAMLRKFYTLSQGRRSNREYYDYFTNLVDALEEVGANIGAHSGIEKQVLEEHDINPARASDAEKQAAKTKAKERYLAVAFLLGSCRNDYGLLIQDIENDSLTSRDKGLTGKYPETVEEAYEYLNNYKVDSRHYQRLLGRVDGADRGINFVTDGSKTGDDDDDSSNNREKEANFLSKGNHKDKTCNRCGLKGHISTYCDSPMDVVKAFRESRQQGGQPTNQSGSSNLVQGVPTWGQCIPADDDNNYLGDFMFLSRGEQTYY